MIPTSKNNYSLQNHTFISHTLISEVGYAVMFSWLYCQLNGLAVTVPNKNNECIVQNYSLLYSYIIMQCLFASLGVSTKIKHFKNIIWCHKGDFYLKVYRTLKTKIPFLGSNIGLMRPLLQNKLV